MRSTFMELELMSQMCGAICRKLVWAIKYIAEARAGIVKRAMDMQMLLGLL